MVSATFREHNTPDEIKGRYVVPRFDGVTLVDYLSGVDDAGTPTFGPIGQAASFDGKTDAVWAAIDCNIRKDLRRYSFDVGVAE